MRDKLSVALKRLKGCANRMKRQRGGYFIGPCLDPKDNDKREALIKALQREVDND